jgi:hypothetical protein
VEPETPPFDHAEHPDEDQQDEMGVADVDTGDAEDPGDCPIMEDPS